MTREMTARLYDLFEKKWYSEPNIYVAEDMTRWGRLLSQLGVERVSRKFISFDDKRIFIKDPSALDPDFVDHRLLVPSEIAEKILVLGYIP